MSTVTAVLSHLPAADVDERLAVLRLVASEACFVVCFAGPEDEFGSIEAPHKLFIDDPTLRGPAQYLQSLTRTFEALWEAHFARHPDRDSLYLIEYDHLILSPTFESELRELAQRTGAELLGKNCVDRTATNDEHYIRFRRDVALRTHLERVSTRDDPARLFGCLGNGIWLSRRALEAYVSVGTHPPCYCETYVPTLIHHLGLRVTDVDASSDLYRDVRWLPLFTADEAMTRLRAGTAFLHPVKEIGTWRSARRLLERAPVSR